MSDVLAIKIRSGNVKATNIVILSLVGEESLGNTVPGFPKLLDGINSSPKVFEPLLSEYGNGMTGSGAGTIPIGAGTTI